MKYAADTEGTAQRLICFSIIATGAAAIGVKFSFLSSRLEVLAGVNPSTGGRKHAAGVKVRGWGIPWVTLFCRMVECNIQTKI